MINLFWCIILLLTIISRTEDVKFGIEHDGSYRYPHIVKCSFSGHGGKIDACAVSENYEKKFLFIEINFQVCVNK